MTSRRRTRISSWPGLLLLWLAAALAALAGCTPPDNPSPAGHLIFIGADGNVYVTTADLSTSIQVTDDATAPAEGTGLSYHRLAWSPGGSLAFAAVERGGSQARGRLYVADAPGSPPRLIAENPDHFYIYVHWAPTPCPGRPDCRRLAYLITEDSGVGLHLVELEGGKVTDRLLATGRPFYLSWAPGGEQIAWHAGDELGVYDLPRRELCPMPAPAPSFRAPAWSAGRWLAVVEGDGRGELASFSDSASTPLLALSGAEIAFSWSPDGSQVACAVRARPDDPFYSPVHLLDPDTGRTQQLTPDPFRPLAFFWSPGGRRLAYLSWLDLPGATWAQWRVVDVATGQDRGFAAFRPTPLMQFALHSFDQYAQSHRFWSPDGRYLVYSERDEGQVDRIWLIDTQAAPGTDPIYVADGPLAYWSLD